mgnify:CR=1 FL=1
MANEDETVWITFNGEIYNYMSLRKGLEGKGHRFKSDTDTEVIAHLVTFYLKQGLKPQEAVDAALPRLKGAFALAMIFTGENDLMIGARYGAVGRADGKRPLPPFHGKGNCRAAGSYRRYAQHLHQSGHGAYHFAR